MGISNTGMILLNDNNCYISKLTAVSVDQMCVLPMV
jgi:hypothetical protein